MTNWLAKILPQDLRKSVLRNLPTTMRPGLPPTMRSGQQPGALPNASVIYGIAASVLFIVGLYFLFFGGAWITGLLIMLPAGCFLGFALHFIKHPH